MLCFVWLSHHTAITSLHSMNCTVTISEIECVYHVVETQVSTHNSSLDKFSNGYTNHRYFLNTCKQHYSYTRQLPQTHEQNWWLFNRPCVYNWKCGVRDKQKRSKTRIPKEKNMLKHIKHRVLYEETYKQLTVQHILGRSIHHAQLPRHETVKHCILTNEKIHPNLTVKPKS